MTTTANRPQMVRRGNHLAWLTVGWNSVEGVVAIASGVIAGSVSEDQPPSIDFQ